MNLLDFYPPAAAAARHIIHPILLVFLEPQIMNNHVHMMAAII